MSAVAFYHGADKHHTKRPNNIQNGAQQGHAHHSVKREEEHTDKRNYIVLSYECYRERTDKERNFANSGKHAENDGVIHKLLAAKCDGFLYKAEFLFLRKIGAVAAVSVNFIENKSVDKTEENASSRVAKKAYYRAEDDSTYKHHGKGYEKRYEQDFKNVEYFILIFKRVAVKNVLFGLVGLVGFGGRALAAYSSKAPHRADDERHGEKVYKCPEKRDEKTTDDGASEEDIYAHIADVECFKYRRFRISVANDGKSYYHRELENNMGYKQSGTFLECGDDSRFSISAVVGGVEVIHLFFAVFEVGDEHRGNGDGKNHGEYQ